MTQTTDETPAPLATLLTQSSGVSVLYERVYDNRLLYVGELRKMGAEIVVAGQTAIITGPTQLVGTHVRSLDLRCAAALVLAGLVAEGTTVVAGQVLALSCHRSIARQQAVFCAERATAAAERAQSVAPPGHS